MLNLNLKNLVVEMNAEQVLKMLNLTKKAQFVLFFLIKQANERKGRKVGGVYADLDDVEQKQISRSSFNRAIKELLNARFIQPIDNTNCGLYYLTNFVLFYEPLNVDGLGYDIFNEANQHQHEVLKEFGE